MSSIRDRIAKAKGAQTGEVETSDTRRKQRGSIRDRIAAAREDNVSVSPETGDVSFPNQIVESAADAIPAALQSATLEWFDDAVEMISPEYANKWREAVAKARERSPKATTLAEILTPDLIDLVTLGGGKLLKAAKFADKFKSANKLDDFKEISEYALKGGAKGTAEGVATDYVTQKGEGAEEFDGMRTAISGMMGGAMGTVTGAIKPRHRMRADVAGLNDDLSKMSRRTEGDILQVDEYTQDTAKMLEDMGIFESKVGAPSKREVYARIQKKRKEIAKGIQGIVDDAGIPVQFNRDDFRRDIARIVQEIGGEEKQQEKTIKEIYKILDPVFGKNRGSANIMEIHEMRKALDQATKWSSIQKKPHKQEVYTKLGSVLRNKVRDRLEDTPFRDLNEQYSRIMDVSETLGDKLGKSQRSKYLPASMGSYNPYVQGIQTVNVLKDKMEGTGAWASEVINKPRLGTPATIEGSMERGARKLIPNTMRDDEEANQPVQIPMRPQSMMSPQERLDLNIPKQLLQMKVPRDSQKIAENPKILEYKIAQHAENLAMKRAVKAGLDPAMIPPEELQDSAREIYENNKMVLNEMPDKIASMLPIWIQEMPELFEDDKYNRIDGVVPASMRMDVQEEIRKKGRYGGELSTHEMIAQLDELTSSGRYLGDKKDKGIA